MDFTRKLMQSVTKRKKMGDDLSQKKIKISSPNVVPWFASHSKTHLENIKEGKPEPEFNEDELSDEFDTCQFLQDDPSDDEDNNNNKMSLPKISEKQIMDRIPSCQVTHWKHVIYNLLVDNHNDPVQSKFCAPYSVRFFNDQNVAYERLGFRFNLQQNPAKRLAELWAFHEKRKDLEQTNLAPVFKSDLYKFYLRACLDLLAKYFTKHDKYTFLYEDIPLFVPNRSLEDALVRLKKLPAKSRKTDSAI